MQSTTNCKWFAQTVLSEKMDENKQGIYEGMLFSGLSKFHFHIHVFLLKFTHTKCIWVHTCAHEVFETENLTQIKNALSKYILSLFYVRWLLSLFCSYRLHFSSLNWLFINVFVISYLVIACLMMKNETAKTTYHHGTTKMLSIYFLCLLSFLLSMQGSTFY